MFVAMRATWHSDVPSPLSRYFGHLARFSRHLAHLYALLARFFKHLVRSFAELMSNFLFAGLLSTRRHEIVERARTVSNALADFMRKCYA
jgi:hypothetical protein